jgi:hypothetical protein
LHGDGLLVCKSLRQHPTLLLHLHTGDTIVWRYHVKSKKQGPLLSLLIDGGLYLLDSLRERLPDNVDDIKDRVRDTYDTASERVSRATDALRGEEDSQILGKVGALLIGVGIGVGIGVLIAPASGEKTRADLVDKISDFSDTVRERAAKR